MKEKLFLNEFLPDTEESILLEFGRFNGEPKLRNFSELGSASVSILAFRNTL